jgi:hypothetical protein
VVSDDNRAPTTITAEGCYRSTKNLNSAKSAVCAVLEVQPMDRSRCTSPTVLRSFGQKGAARMQCLIFLNGSTFSISGFHNIGERIELFINHIPVGL